MTTAERIAKILAEIEGVASMYGVNDWQRRFLYDVRGQRRPLSEKQEKALREIERKVFAEQDE